MTKFNWLLSYHGWVFLFALMASSGAFAEGTWKGSIPAIAQSSQNWSSLVESLLKTKMSFGAMAASARILAFFDDMPSKQTAYHSIIELMDQGYPEPVNRLFISGDLEARGDSTFVNSYNLIKYTLNHEKGMDRWAKEYYDKLGGDGFPKYQFYLAVETYAQATPEHQEKLDESILHLKEVLSADKGTGSGTLAIKAARTLARIYFEKKQYAKSLGIYTSFLLKLNPIYPSDWLEAAWNDYYLKRYPEALGLLYNLESRTAGSVLPLEKYELRALIYRENCAVGSAETLLASFNRDFGSAITGLKEGASPKDYPILTRVETGPGSKFEQISNGLFALKKEASLIDVKLPESQRPLARYLYDSEKKLLEAERDSELEVTLDHAAEEVVTTSEQLKFLKYDVAREKFDPDQIFRPTENQVAPTLVPTAEGELGAFQIRWPQQGDFWRNERLSFKGEITQQCHD